LRHIEFALACIQRALSSVQRDRHLRAVLSPEISDYLIDLAVKYPDDGSEFSRFVMSLPYNAIHHEILRQLLPENLRQSVSALRAEHDEIQLLKENEIAEGNFDNAADFRDRQDRLAMSIQEALGDQKLVVTPKTIGSVLKLLGYNGS
jgi:hypothetical protein